MKTLVIDIDKDSSLKKLLELAKKLRLKTKVVDVKKEDQEREDWMRMGVQNISSAYSNDEPDISGLTLMEPNPKYKPSV